MRLGTIQTLHKKLWQWISNQLAHEVPASDGLCEFDCRKPQCTEEESATCERRIRSAAGELWPDTKPASTPPRPPVAVDYGTILASQSENEQTLARLRCAHCQSLFNCDRLAQAVLTELRHCRIEYRRVGADDPEVTDAEFNEALRRGIDRFLRESFGSDENDESCPPAA